MATVKGDVHDIGKNIVGVVLQCNNYEVIDLGVMVPCERILETARAENADIIGLSGLITPSLDEMVHVASEMERLGFDVPLLIGGATTSRAHTAVRIEPAYQRGPTVYVTDASRGVGVASALLSDEQRGAFVSDVRNEYEAIRVRSNARADKTVLLPYSAAVAEAPAIDWSNFQGTTPRFLGTRVLNDYPLEELAQYIDWSPFFMTWELAGKFPKILNDPIVGEAARAVYARRTSDAAQRIIDERWISANGVFGFWRAQRSGSDDIDLFDGAESRTPIATLHHLRQQSKKGAAGPHFSLADFVAPAPHIDYVGAFAVNAGTGIEKVVAKFEAAQRRLQRDHAEGAGRPARRSVRGASPRARPEGVLGIQPRRSDDHRRSHRRELSRHPTRAGLSGLSRSYREGHAVLAARTGTRQHVADGAFRDAAGGSGRRLVLLAPRRPILRGWQNRT